jgi:hypothetical protein
MTSLKGHCKSTRNYKTQVTNKTKQQNKAKQPQQTEKKNKHRKKKNHKTLATAEGGGGKELASKKPQTKESFPLAAPAGHVLASKIHTRQRMDVKRRRMMVHLKVKGLRNKVERRVYLCHIMSLCIISKLVYFLKLSLDQNLIMIYYKFNVNFKNHINFRMM